MPAEQEPTACLALADGTLFYGQGFGATGEIVADITFTTAMSGYQESMSDPATAGHIIVYTFPHIGNTGVSPEDDESDQVFAAGMVVRCPLTDASSWRAEANLQDWLVQRGQIGISGVDTRRLTRLIRQHGHISATLIHDRSGHFDTERMVAQAKEHQPIPGIIADPAGSGAETPWRWSEGNGQFSDAGPKVAVVDFGSTKGALRALATAGCEITVFPASMPVAEVLAHKPDGIFLSNGPGDARTCPDSVISAIRALAQSGLPLFGIGLGHQLLAISLGGKIHDLAQGHHGANHPVKSLENGRVRIATVAHDSVVDADTLPENVTTTYSSLFSGSNFGLAIKGRPVFSVQHLPQGSPGPHDSIDLFDRFAEMARAHRLAS